MLDFYYLEDSRPSPRLMETLTAIGYELGEFFSRRRAQLDKQRLTQRELQVIRLASEGQAAPQIAERLEISATTVRTHLEHIYRKLDVSDRATAVAVAIRLGLIE